MTVFLNLYRRFAVPALVAIAVLSAVGPEAVAQVIPSFNHTTTGFVLEGAHSRLQCDSCHKSGLPTKGVPRTCVGCHVQGGFQASVAQPATHIPTPPGQSCQDCHNQNNFRPALMRHTPEMFGQCSRCHNGLQAPGKPASHFPTTLSCDACHTTGAFMPPKVMIHDGSSVGRCSTCHNGKVASGKASFHVPTTAQCDTCHTSTVTWLNAQYTHDPSSWGRCSTCHNGQTAKGRQPGVHIPTNAQCDTCHTSQVTFTARTMNHTGLGGQCSTCHSGTYVSQNAQMKPPTHVQTTAQCDACHQSTVTWATTTFDHSSVAAANNCSTCHVASAPPASRGLSKPITHIPTNAQCDTCHLNTIRFKPATMNHSGMTGQCSTCHNGSYVSSNAQSRPATHIPTTRSCDACHLNFVAFFPATMDHTGLTGQCSTCHSGAYLAQNAQMKPVTHVATTAQCDSCHSSTVSWATKTYAHDATAYGNCSTCHKPGGPGLAKPTNHVPNNQQCDTCHTNFVSFKPAYMNHTGAAGLCSTCHNGSYIYANAEKQGATHIPDSRQCDTCHTSTVVWTLRNMVHPANAPGQCSSCHSGQYLTENAQMKPPTHPPTTAQCDACHTSTTTWSARVGGTGIDHSLLTPPLICSNCHTPGGGALSKPTTHIPTTAQCNTCHTNYVTFKPAFMSHTGATGPAATVGTGFCSTCHNNTYSAVNALPQGTTHIPTSAACDKCHTSTVGWTIRSMDHTVVAATSCKACHSGAYLTENAQARSPGHIQIFALDCNSCHTNFATFSPAQMNHIAVGTPSPTPCYTCHNGAYLAANAQARPASPPHTLDTTCNTCHNTSSWATSGRPDHTPFSNNCTNAGCHAPGGTGLNKPTLHIPTTSQCDTCHNKSGATFKPATMNHAGTAGPVATIGAGFCSSCHISTYAFANANPKGTTHIPTGAACDACHKTGYTNWTVPVTNMNHALVTATTCSTCHNGAYLSEKADKKGSSHIPTTLECNKCHKSTVIWTVPIADMDHTGLTGQCTTCHSGGYLSSNAQMKGATHIPTSAQCDACHISFLNWNTVKHLATGIAGQCESCHNGGYTAAKAVGTPPTHIPYKAQLLAGSAMNCDACHNSTVTWSQRMNHNGSQGNGSGFCKGCHVSKVFLGSYQTKSLTHNKSTGVTDCSQSGCHRPLGNRGSAYNSW